jgi:hypothetical protein
MSKPLKTGWHGMEKKQKGLGVPMRAERNAVVAHTLEDDAIV